MKDRAMASEYTSNETNKKPIEVYRPSYGPVKAANSTIEQVSQPFRDSHQQQGLPTAFSEASLARHEHRVDPRGQVMLDRWLRESSNNDPYNAVGTVFAEGRAQYNTKAQKRSSNTAVRDTL